MRTFASRLLVGALLVVVAGLVLGFESQGSTGARRSFGDARTLVAHAGMDHIRGVDHPSRHTVASLPLALRGCAAWLRGASLSGYINALVCDSHTSAIEARAYVVKTGHLGGSGLETAINGNLFFIVIAPTQRTADRLTATVAGA